MQNEVGDVMIPALSPAAGLPRVGADEKAPTPTDVTSAVQRAVLIATRRRRRTHDWM